MQKVVIDQEPKNVTYPCTGCGVCCLHIRSAVEGARLMLMNGEKAPYVADVAAFPYKYDEAGKCENLMEDHRCRVYDHRPDVCDVAKVWEKYHSKMITRQDYFISTAELCNSMMVEAKTTDNFFIDTSKINV